MRLRIGILYAFAMILLIAILAHGPMIQDEAYHAFADERAWLGIPYFLDVASNLPFLVVGLAGLFLVPRWGTRFRASTPSWITFFAGVSLVFFGSSFYHWAPSDERLVWDRLPMTVGFMGCFSALLIEFVDERASRILPVWLAFGAVSIVIWRMTGDLRLYVWVQAAPMLCIPLVMLLFRSPWSGQKKLVFAFFAYGFAKLFEAWDARIFLATHGVVSGHTLKHLSAALAPGLILSMLLERRPKAVPRRTVA